MAIVYILFSKNTNKFYTGSSREDGTSLRLIAHNNGRVRSTRNGRPWVVVKTEKFDNYTDARKREIFLKSGVGRNVVRAEFGVLKETGAER